MYESVGCVTKSFLASLALMSPSFTNAISSRPSGAFELATPVSFASFPVDAFSSGNSCSHFFAAKRRWFIFSSGLCSTKYTTFNNYVQCTIVVISFLFLSLSLLYIQYVYSFILFYQLTQQVDHTLIVHTRTSSIFLFFLLLLLFVEKKKKSDYTQQHNHSTS